MEEGDGHDYRSLRDIVIALAVTTQWVPRVTGFLDTLRSEVMAILCLATGINDLKTSVQHFHRIHLFGQTGLARDLRRRVPWRAFIRRSQTNRSRRWKAHRQ